MAYSVFNGWNIIPMPATPFMQADFHMMDSVAATQSPFTFQSQVQSWPGADYWAIDVSLPPMMKSTETLSWIAFFAALRGKQNIFQVSDTSRSTPLGTPLGSPVTNGTVLSMAQFLPTRGWTASKTNLLLPGDLIQFGYRVHVVCQPVNSDSSGHASMEIWPSVREAPADGTTIITSNTSGVFRLTDNLRTYSLAQNHTYAFSFKAIEAR